MIKKSGVLRIIGPELRIRCTMWQPALITRAIRSDFMKLDSSKQAEFIGLYAKKRLKSIDRIISKLLPNEGLKAADLWLKIVESRGGSDLSVVQKINNLYPALESKSEKIARLFAKTYVFWVHNYYSCDLDGNITKMTCQFSDALFIKHHKKEMINERSEMPYLAEQIEAYANFLYRKICKFPFIYG